jgi:hypothetical protein
MAKRIITTLLAIQLLVTAGLCGGACCASTRESTDRGLAAAQDSNDKPATAVKTESAHCPLHAAKMTKLNPQERKVHSSDSVRRSIASRHQNHHQASLPSPITAHFCACDVERDKRSFDALLQRVSEQRWAFQGHPSAINHPHGQSHWLIDQSAAQIPSTNFFHAHSPPFDGRRLNLRI